MQHINHYGTGMNGIVTELRPQGIELLEFTVVSNMRINNEVRLQRLKDSFASFCCADIPKWIINIRGSLKHEAADFLSNALGDKLALSFKESNEGWFFDTRQMLKEASIDTTYVFYWVEDSICLVKSYILNCIVSEMSAMDAEIMLYTLYMNGNTNKKFYMLPYEQGKNINVIIYDSLAFEVMSLRMEERFLPYTVALPSFFSTALFKKLVWTDTPMPPEWKNTPFAMEKGGGDLKWMPIRTALSKVELFGAVDDNQTTPNSCLSARGLYPVDVPDRKTMGDIDGGEVSGTFTAPVYAPLPPRPLWIEYARNMWRNKFDEKSRGMFIQYIKRSRRRVAQTLPLMGRDL